MEYVYHVPKTALARKTRQVIQAVQRGQTVVVEHHGQPEAAIMDIVDYYLLRAVIHFYANRPQIDPAVGLGDETAVSEKSAQERANLVIAHYLAGAISLSRASELLDLPWLDLRTRFLRLDIPVRSAPTSDEDILGDLENAAAYTKSSQ